MLKIEISITRCPIVHRASTMILLRIALFFFGTTIASCHVLRNGKLCIHGHDKHFPEIIEGTNLTPPSIPTFALPFIQQGTNLFYKPQFMTPGTVIQPAVPFHSQLISLEKPQFTIQEAQHIPQAPVIVPASVETNSIVTSQQPEVSPQYGPEIVEYEVTELKPAAIPEAPALPPFTMPELPPVIIPFSPEISADIEVQPAPEPKPIDIPEAPVLPPFSEVELQPVIVPTVPESVEIEPAPEPKPIKIPEAPVLPPFSEVELQPVIVSTIPESIEIKPAPEPKPIEISEAPILPPLIMPELPPVVIPIASSQEIPECDDHLTQDLKPLQISAAPALTVPETSVVVEFEAAPESTPAKFPEAPVLPSFTMPELPTIIIPITPDIPADIEIHPAAELKPIEIPEAPVLPPMVVPELQPIPDCVDQPASDYKPIEIPEAPSLPPFSTPELPPIIIPIGSELPEISEIQPSPEFIPIEVPEAPVLPPFNLLELQPVITSAQENPEFDDQSAPDLKPIEISEAPVLPPFTIPELPPVIISNSPENPAFVEIETAPEPKPIEIPTAPVLPTLAITEISDNTVSDCDDKPISELQVIPEAPTLPPVTEILEPVKVVRPADSDCPSSEDNVEPEPELDIKNFEIPPPPQLPSSEISTIHNLNKLQLIPVAIPDAPQLASIDLQITPEVIEFQPLPRIPEAPQLPAFNLLHTPTKIIEVEPVQVFKQSKNIPPPPVLPEYEVQEVEFKPAEPKPITISTMQPIVVTDSNEEPCRDDKPPLYQQFLQPTFWAQNIIIERVLPNMLVSDKEYAKSLAAETKYPVITKPYFI